MVKKISLAIAVVSLITISCKTKKTATTTSSTNTTTTKLTIVPGTEQLKAIQAKFPDVTMQTLTDGHGIYIGACTNCHGQKNIQKRSIEKWMHEIDDMSPKAKLTEKEKDALTKYILSMKYTEPVVAK